MTGLFCGDVHTRTLRRRARLCLSSSSFSCFFFPFFESVAIFDLFHYGRRRRRGLNTVRSLVNNLDKRTYIRVKYVAMAQEIHGDRSYHANLATRNAVHIYCKSPRFQENVKITCVPVCFHTDIPVRRSNSAALDILLLVIITPSSSTIPSVLPLSPTRN